MPKTKFSDGEFQKLYREVQHKTKNFSIIEPELISKNPNYMKVFRMMCGRSLAEMGNILNKTHATISQYERGAIKNIPIKEAEKISHIVSDELPQNKSLENSIRNIQKFRELSNGGYIQAFKRAEKAELTNQEKKVKEILEKKKIEFEPHKTLDTSIGKLNFDFWLPGSKVVIECTESVSKHKAESLGFRVLKLKDKVKCKAIAVVPSNVSDGIMRRLCDYDHVVFSTDLSKLENIVE